MAKKKPVVVDIPDDEMEEEFSEQPVVKAPKKKSGPKKKELPFPLNLDEIEEAETPEAEEEKVEEVPEEKEPEPVIQRKPMEIRQASIKDDLFCSYAWDNYSNNEFVGPSRHSNLFPIHSDLRAAFEKLNVHLASIFENDVNQADKVKVLAFKLEGKPTPTGVVFSGYKVLSSGEHGKVETPVTRFHGNYVNAEEMQEDVMTCIAEVEKYHGGKHAPILVQQSFDFATEEESDINKTIEGKKEVLDADKFDVEVVNLADLPEEAEYRMNKKGRVSIVDNIELSDEEPADTDPFASTPGFGSDFPNDDGQLF